MIKNYNDFINEGLRDSMKPVDREDLSPEKQEKYDIMIEMQKVVDNYKPIATKVEISDDGFSVLVEDENSEIKNWVDIYLNGEEYVCEWNQYIFGESDEDQRLKQFQETEGVFGMTEECAMSKLQEENLLDTDDDGNYV